MSLAKRVRATSIRGSTLTRVGSRASSRTSSRRASTADDATARASHTRSLRELRTAGAALVVTALIALGLVAWSRQSFEEGVALMFNASIGIDPAMEPADKAHEIASRIQTRVVNREVRDLFKPQNGEGTEDVTARMRAAVAKAHLTSCPVLDDLRPRR